jgi:hypothetical protein
MDKIAIREGKSRSAIIVKAVKTYAKNHSSGNNQITLETAIQPGFIALPTIGEPLTERFAQMDNDELIILAKTLRGRSQEVNVELKRRGLDWGWRWSLDYYVVSS